MRSGGGQRLQALIRMVSVLHCVQISVLSRVQGVRPRSPGKEVSLSQRTTTSISAARLHYVSRRRLGMRKRWKSDARLVVLPRHRLRPPRAVLVLRALASLKRLFVCEQNLRLLLFLMLLLALRDSIRSLNHRILPDRPLLVHLRQCC